MNDPINLRIALLNAANLASAELSMSFGSELTTPEEACKKALAHLAPFFAQSVHSGTVERTGHVAENHGTGDLELLKVVGLAQRIIDAVDQQLESEFGGFYLSAPDDEPLGKVRRMLRGEAAP